MGTNVGLSVGGVLGAIVAIVVFVRISVSDQGNVEEADAVKAIGLSFVQVLTLLSTFDIEWPQVFTSIFQVGGAVMALG